MTLLASAPPDVLRPYVAAIWHYRDGGLVGALEQVVPDGAAQLLVNLDDDVLSWRSAARPAVRLHARGAVLGGAGSEAVLVDAAQQRAVTGVSFVPGGASAFFGPDTSEYRDRYVVLADLPRWRGVRDALLEAEALGGAAGVLGCWRSLLLERLAPVSLGRVARAVRLLDAGDRVAEVADALAISSRRLHAEFTSAVGLPPKPYARVRRLQRLVRAVATRSAVDAQRPDWASLALAHGYADQAHLIRDFRAIGGMTPTRYRPRRAEDWNHSVVDATVPIRPIPADAPSLGSGLDRIGEKPCAPRERR